MVNWLTFWAGFTAAAAIGQAVVAVLLWHVNRRMMEIQATEASKDRPILRIYWNGFQSQPKNPNDEMLLFLITVVNEGRRPAHFGSWGLETHDDGHWTEQGLTGFAGAEGEVMPTWESVHARDSESQGADKVVNPFSAKMLLCWLPAGGGWEEWSRVQIHFTPIGGERAEREIDWNLFWLRRES